MRKKYTLITLLVGMALILAACAGNTEENTETSGGAVNGTEEVEKTPGGFNTTPEATTSTGLATATSSTGGATAVATSEATKAATATTMPTKAATATESAGATSVSSTQAVTGTQGVPGTGLGVMSNFGLACTNFAEFNVTSKDGQKLGEAQDLVINVKSGRVMYLVVKNEKGDFVLVPWGAVSVVAAQSTTLLGGQKSEFQLTINADAFNKAPVFNDEQYKSFLDNQVDNWDKDLQSYWKAFVTAIPNP